MVQTYNAGRPVWSCCWCLDENNYMYAGLVNGSVLVYDLRNTSSHIQELVPQKARYGAAHFFPVGSSFLLDCYFLILSFQSVSQMVRISHRGQFSESTD